MIQVVVEGAGEDTNVIYKDETIFVKQAFQDSVHHSLKGAWSVSQTKGHHVEGVSAKVGNESAFLLGLLSQATLPKTRLQIAGRKNGH